MGSLSQFLRALDAAATPGPFTVECDNTTASLHTHIVAPSGLVAREIGDSGQSDATIRALAALRNLAGPLAAVVEAGEALLGERDRIVPYPGGSLLHQQFDALRTALAAGDAAAKEV